MQAPQNALNDPRFADLAVLVVDQSPYMITLTGDLLASFGFQKIETAQSVGQAEEIIRRNALDLVLFDLMDSNPNGLALARKIREGKGHRNQLVPLILMTAKADRETIFGARDLGTTEFLRKPFTAKELFKKTHSVINNPRAFIDTEEYFGPDRRRRSNQTSSQERRKTPPKIVTPGAP